MSDEINIDCSADEHMVKAVREYQRTIAALRGDLERCYEEGRRMAGTIGELRHENEELRARLVPKEDQ